MYNPKLIVLLLFVTFTSISQTREVLVLKEKISHADNDTTKVRVYLSLAKKCMYATPFVAKEYAQRGKQLAKKINFNSGYIENELMISQINIQLGEYANALSHLFELETFILHQSNNQYLADVYVLISSIYVDLNKKDLALNYLQKAKTLFIEKKDNIGLANAYYSIGIINNLSNKKEEAKINFELALSFFPISNHKRPYVIVELASINGALQNHKLATKFFLEGLKVSQINQDILCEVKCLNRFADYYFSIQKYSEAEKYYTKSLSLSQQYHFPINELHSFCKLAFLNDRIGRLSESVGYFKQYNTLKDSIFNATNAKLISEFEVKFDTEHQKRLLAISNSQIENKNYQIYLFRIVFVLFILLLLFFIYFLIDKTKINKVILIQKKEVETKNQVIEEKNKLVESQNKDIRDSIKYAQRIQSAILPPQSFWSSILPESFVFYRPKEVLSGDFHWIAETDTHIFVAAADCTGHGVPGAFISIVNYNLLNKAVLEKGITDTALILDAVNTWLTESLHQTYEESSVKDGMDVSLISIDKQTNEVYFSGAYNSIYLVRNHKLIEYKGDKFPVGVFIEDELNQFQKLKIEIESGDMLYLFTDGYADQFGGPKGKKFKYAQLRDQLVSISNTNMNQQCDEIIKTFESWKGKLEQVDDVLILGIRF